MEAPAAVLTAILNAIPYPTVVLAPAAVSLGQRITRDLLHNGQICPTNRQQMIKRPDRRLSDQASDLHFLVAGAGFEPATSGL
jgi:hypothetical protein